MKNFIKKELLLFLIMALTITAVVLLIANPSLWFISIILLVICGVIVFEEF